MVEHWINAIPDKINTDHPNEARGYLFLVCYYSNGASHHHLSLTKTQREEGKKMGKLCCGKKGKANRESRGTYFQL